MSFSKSLSFVQYVLRLQRLHVVEQDVLVLFYLSRLDLRVFFIAVLRLLTFSDLVLAFQRFAPVSIACR